MKTRKRAIESDEGSSVDRFIVAIGVLLILLGLFSVMIPSINPTPESALNNASNPLSLSWVFATLTHLGPGLVAAGLLTILLEPSNQKRHRQEISEIRKFTAEKIIETLIPDELYREINRNMIQKPFIRKSCQASVNLTWKEKYDKSYLSMSDVYSYEVENHSPRRETHGVRVYEDKLNEVKYPKETKILEVQIIRKNKPVDIYKDDRLLPYLTETAEYIQAVIPIDMEPHEVVEVSYHIVSIQKARDAYPYVSILPTIGLKLIITHPEDLNMNQVPLHSDPENLCTEEDSPNQKIWRIRTGLLPYQGLLLVWSPK